MSLMQGSRELKSDDQCDIISLSNLQLTISSARAGHPQLLHHTLYLDTCHDSVMMHRYIIIVSQLKLRQKHDRKTQCDGKRVYLLHLFQSLHFSPASCHTERHRF